MKLLKIDDVNKEKIINKFIEELKEKLNKEDSDGTFRFSFSVDGNLEKKRKLYISPTAYIKMLLLVYNYNSEIGWYGTSERVEDDGYMINDIFVYPQTVSGSTVDTDQEKFKEWLDSLDDDVFKNLRFNGHSHVNMSVTPSSVDMNGRESDLNSLRKDDFQIFMIMNKRRDFSIDIYDRRDNAIYETNDIEIYITGCAVDTFNVINDSKNVVKNATYTTPVSSMTSKKTTVKKDAQKIFGSKYDFEEDEYDYEDPYSPSYRYYGYKEYGY